MKVNEPFKVVANTIHNLAHHSHVLRNVWRSNTQRRYGNHLVYVLGTSFTLALFGFSILFLWFLMVAVAPILPFPSPIIINWSIYGVLILFASAVDYSMTH